MPTTPQPEAVREHAPRNSGRLPLPLLRYAALVAWAILLVTFWLLVRNSGTGPADLLARSEALVTSVWAPAALLLLYLLRPLLLVPITALNLTAGFVLGPFPGIALAASGTLVSASAGYLIGRLLGSGRLAEELAQRWAFVRMLRSRSFEAVVGGGLMYLHADMVNLPAGILRIRFPVFLVGIAVGNSLTLTMAVVTGAAFDSGSGLAGIELNYWYLAAALLLFLTSILLAHYLRRRLRPQA